MGIEDNNSTENLLTVIDLGTESIRVMMARMESDGSLKMLGCGDTRTNRKDGCEEQAVNIRKGLVRNPMEVHRMLRRAMDEAVRNSGVTVIGGHVYIGTTDSVRTVNVQETMHSGHSGIFSEEEVVDFTRRIREHYDCLSLNVGKCLHTYTRFYRLDDGRYVYDVTGIPSKSVTASIQGVIFKNETMAMLENMVKDIVKVRPRPLYIPLAMSYAVDMGTELSNGVLLIDIGAGVVSYCVSRGGACVQVGHIPVGCNHIENDLMQAFGIEWKTARDIVRKLETEIGANILNEDDERRRMVAVESRGTYDGRASSRQRRVPVSSIEKVIRLRVREMFMMVVDALKKEEALWHVGGAVILSGGGALIPGIEGVAAEVFEKPVRLAKTANGGEKGIIYNDSRDIVPLGLLKLAMEDIEIRKSVSMAGGEDASFGKLLKKIWRAMNW